MVKRWSCAFSESADEAYMTPDDCGDYILFEDYENATEDASYELLEMHRKLEEIKRVIMGDNE